MLKRYSKDFWLLSASMFFFMLSFNLILPEMNGFISGLGGSEVKGSIIFLFSVAAGVSRPFAGRLADLIGRKRSVFIGLGIAIAASISYAWVGALSVFFILRFAHGLSAGFAPTGATALLTDILPPGRKGAAMGLWGTFISLGIGVGQALGSYIFERSNFDTLFMTSAAFGILALLLLSPIKETLPEQQAFQWRQLLIKWEDVVEPSVKPAALIMLLTAISSGLIFVLTPDYSTYLGIGRRETMVIGCSLLVLSMVLLGYANDVWSYSFAAVIFGLATGISSPTLFAWTADLSLTHRRGTGSGTLFIALEIGILIGSGLTFLFYKNTIESARHCLFIAAGFGVIALLILLVQIRSAKSINA